MKNWSTSSSKICSFLSAGLLVLAAGCGKDDKPADSNCTSAKYVVANVLGAFPNQTSYLQTLADVNVTSLGTFNSFEVPKSATIWKGQGSTVYSTEFGNPATMRKYKVSGSCRLEEEQRLVLPGTNTFSSIEFLSATEAVASTGGGLAQVIVFDPTAMRITGNINIAATKLPGAASVFYCGSAVSGNKMFLAIASFDGSFTEAFDSCHIAVIDLPTKRIEKIISDPRMGHVFHNGPLVSAVQKDANGDIYWQGMGYTTTAGKTVPAGILRIKAGETTFDPTYFFNLKTAAGGKNCYGFYHFANGQTFTTRIDDPAGLYFNPVCKFMKIDLANKTATELPGVPLVVGGSCTLMRKIDDNTILFNVDAGTTKSMWQYNIGTGTAAKKFDMPGSCIGFERL